MLGTEKIAPSEAPLPRYAQLYFDFLWNDIVCKDALRQLPEFLELEKSRESGLTWGRLLALENFLLTCRSTEEKRRIAWLIRMKYRSVAGADDYALYINSKPPALVGVAENDALLEADLRLLLHEIHWLYAIIPEREHARRRIGWLMLMLTIALAVVVIATYFWYRHFDPPREMPLLPVVMALGSLGGFVSAQRRLSRMREGGDRIRQLIYLEKNRLQYVIPPVSGATFAVVILLLFVSGLLQGDLFPKMTTPTRQTVDNYLASNSRAREPLSGEGVNVLYVASMTEPTDGKEFGKLLVWCFIAGFAEQLVPGVLGRLITNSAEKGA